MTELDEDTVVALVVVVVVVVVVCEGWAEQPSGGKALEPQERLDSPNPLEEKCGGRRGVEGGEVWWEGGREGGKIGHFGLPLSKEFSSAVFHTHTVNPKHNVSGMGTREGLKYVVNQLRNIFLYMWS